MNFPEEIHEVLKKTVENKGISNFCKEAKLNYRTVKTACETGKTSTLSYKAIVQYLKSEKIKQKKDVKLIYDVD